ncbi:MAG: hypothetical protein IPP77_10900 [Bacteroidetes bacterium]|nr:hypothetical protein [Bacteroidota bacterium]
MSHKVSAILFATEEALHDFDRFTDADIACELFQLFEYRMLEETGLLEQEKKYADFNDEFDLRERELVKLSELIEKLNYDSTRMLQEIIFLYNATTVGYFKEVVQLLTNYIRRLEGLGANEEILFNEIKRKANEKIAIRYRRGRKEEIKYEIIPDKPFLKFDESILIDYVEFLKQQVDRFKEYISQYLNRSPKVRSKNIPQSSEAKSIGFTLDEIEQVFRKDMFDKFVEICNRYTTPIIESEKLVREALIELEDSNYVWIGLRIGKKTNDIGDRIIVVESLGHFIHTLIEKQYIRKGIPKRKLARIFISHFHIKAAPKYLAQEILLQERFHPFFSDIN